MSAEAKKVFYNCTVREKKGTWWEDGALALENGKVVACGEREEIISRYGDWPGRDLKGQILLSGFNDAHLHFYQLGTDLSALDLSQVSSRQELRDKIADEIESKSQAEVIMGVRLNDSRFPEERLPERDFLDSFSTEKPIILRRICYHAAAVNSQTLKLAGIEKETADPEGGKIGRYPDGSPNGLLFDSAVELVLDKLPEPGISDLTATLELSGKHLLEKGITSAGIDDLRAVRRPEDMLAAYQDYLNKTEVRPRLYLQQRIKNTADLEKLMEISRPTGEGNEDLRYGPIKIMLDGSLGARTAALSTSYLDDPGNKGELLLNADNLRELLKRGYHQGFIPAIHAIGDWAIKTALEAIKKSAPNKKMLKQSQIIHCQLTRPGLINELGREQIWAIVQPVFIKSDRQMVKKRLDQELQQNSFAWQSLSRAGVQLAFSSDAPIEPVNPLYGIESALSRQDWQGRPEQGFLPQEKMDLDQALELYTKAGARISGEAPFKGSLSPGQLADFIVLEEDPRQLKAANLSKLKIQETYLAGNRVV